MGKIGQFLKAMRIEQREHRSSFIVFTVLRLSALLEESATGVPGGSTGSARSMSTGRSWGLAVICKSV